MTSILKTDTENKLILYLLQTNSPEDEFQSLLQSGVNWDLLFQAAEEHRVVPLVFKRLKSDHSDSVAEDTLDKFHARYEEIAKFNFARSTQLIKLVGELQKQDLPVIAYKGMALAEFAYKDTTLRQFGDIDLLIRKEDFPEAKKLLMQIGCKPAWGLTEKQEKATLKYYYEYPFFYGEIDTLVEVHWEFLESFFAFDVKMAEIWNRSRKIKLYGREMKTLSPEDYMVVLCTHGSKHFWNRLSWICDVAELIKNTGIDWDLVERLSDKTGSLRMVRLGLFLCRELLSIEIPGEMAEQVAKDAEVAYIGGKIKSYILRKETEPSEWTEVAKLHLKMREKPLTKIKYSQRLFMTKLVDKLFMPMGRPR